METVRGKARCGACASRGGLGEQVECLWRPRAAQIERKAVIMTPTPIVPGPGQESVWDYPRPAKAEPTGAHLSVIFAGQIIAETRRGVRTLETSHPPTYYFPPDDVATERLQPGGHRSHCEWKGEARYFDLRVAGHRAANAAWTYPAPTPAFEILSGYIAFYPGLMEACLVDGERAQPQPGGFYGGWVTHHVTGPFKGGPGSRGW